MIDIYEIYREIHEAAGRFAFADRFGFAGLILDAELAISEPPSLISVFGTGTTGLEKLSRRST